ncbi:MAG: hypothetical protein DMF62_00185 [Acidobacteria bacterium]|nr:MAG: hypothetical protein DMF62_00185 [Acidobacteriota bacterium]
MKTKFSILLMIILSLAVGGFAQQVTLRASNSQVRTILASLERRTDEFKTEMKRSFNQSNANTASREDRIMDLIEEFEDSTDRLRTKFNNRQSIDVELAEVYTDAQTINSFMVRNRMTGRAETLWTSIRGDLNTLGGYYTQTFTWNGPVATTPTYSVFTGNEAQLRALIQRIENKTDTYKNRMGNALDRSAYDGRPEEREIMDYISEFENATNRLRDRFNNRQSTGADATEVLNRGLYIDRFMTRNAFTRPAESQWVTLRNDLNTLASVYRVSWNWNMPLPTYPGTPTGNGPGRTAALSGTYRLNTSRSDNVANIITTSVSSYETSRRDQLRRNLERRLASPEMIAINANGREIEMATSSSNRVSFTADGTARTETNPRGRTVTTTVRLNRRDLEVNYTGDRMNDFYVTFSPSGDQLVVTKRIYIENQNQTVTVRSVYDRVSDNADWTAVNAGTVSNGGGQTGAYDFYIPNGTSLNATLNSNVTTRGTQIGDHFTMTVNSPGQYRGAIIDGHIAEARSSQTYSGRARISMEFDTISMNGRTYRFAGVIDSVTAANGDRITVNNEGAIRDSNQTTQAVTRAGIGAVIGGIIGAIAGGGSGAAIGAGVGAGVGAGSVLITGRDTIDLTSGSTFNITAYAPAGTRIGAN